MIITDMIKFHVTGSDNWRKLLQPTWAAGSKKSDVSEKVCEVDEIPKIKSIGVLGDWRFSNEQSNWSSAPATSI